MGLALALKDAVRSGALYLPQSKHHVSCWDLTLSDTRWPEVQTSAYDNLQQPVVRKNWISVPCKGFPAFSHRAT